MELDNPFMGGDAMNKAMDLESVNALSDWQQLFEAALLESDPAAMAERFKSAKDAIMDRIEDCFESASLSERGLLLSALNTISDLETLSRPEEIRRRPALGIVGHAA